MNILWARDDQKYSQIPRCYIMIYGINIVYTWALIDLYPQYLLEEHCELPGSFIAIDVMFVWATVVLDNSY